MIEGYLHVSLTHTHNKHAGRHHQAFRGTVKSQASIKAKTDSDGTNERKVDGSRDGRRRGHLGLYGSPQPQRQIRIHRRQVLEADLDAGTAVD